MTGVVATARIVIAAPVSTVWSALTDPARIKQYFLGADVDTDWNPGSPIVWSGEYEGKPFEDKGEILEVEANHRLKMTHFSPMSGQPDRPEKYHTLTYELEEHDDGTHLRLSQDNNGDEDEAARAGATWSAVLEGLKKTAEEA